MEVVDYLFLGGVVGVAFRVESRDASAVLFPLVLPEALIVALVILPKRVHVVEEVGLAGSGNDGGYIGIGTGGVAVGVVGAVAMVRPAKC